MTVPREGDRSAFHFQVLDHLDRIAIRQGRSIAVFYRHEFILIED